MLRRGRAIERLSQSMGHISQLTLDSMTFADTSRKASGLGTYLHMENDTPEPEGEHGPGRRASREEVGRLRSLRRIGLPSGLDCLKRMHIKVFGPAKDAAVQTGAQRGYAHSRTLSFPLACILSRPD